MSSSSAILDKCIAWARQSRDGHVAWSDEVEVSPFGPRVAEATARGHWRAAIMDELARGYRRGSP